MVRSKNVRRLRRAFLPQNSKRCDWIGSSVHTSSRERLGHYQSYDGVGESHVEMSQRDCKTEFKSDLGPDPGRRVEQTPGDNSDKQSNPSTPSSVCPA